MQYETRLRSDATWLPFSQHHDPGPLSYNLTIRYLYCSSPKGRRYRLKPPKGLW